MESSHTSGTGWSPAWCCQFHRWRQTFSFWSSSESPWEESVLGQCGGSPSFQAPEIGDDGIAASQLCLLIEMRQICTLRRIPEFAFGSLSCTLQWLNSSCSSLFSSILDKLHLSGWLDRDKRLTHQPERQWIHSCFFPCHVPLARAVGCHQASCLASGCPLGFVQTPQSWSHRPLGPTLSLSTHQTP